jgi:hypothetical protein
MHDITHGIVLAHGVGRVYQLPVPLFLYLLGAAATVLASFFIRILSPEAKELKAPRAIAGRSGADVLSVVLRLIGLAAVVVTVVFGITDGGRGLVTSTLVFWVVLIVGFVVISCLVDGAWAAADPWSLIIPADETEDGRVAPWWAGPLSIYTLFWFELVSGLGFESSGVVLALGVYTAYTILLRTTFKGGWKHADPLWILFGFASRAAPFALTHDAIEKRPMITGLDERDPMPLALFSALFVLMASTTLDNVRQTVGWTDLLDTLGLTPSKLVDSITLILFVGVFLGPFMLTMLLAHRWLSESKSTFLTARHFAWSLVPIGVAYVLAHNVSLIAIGFPTLVRDMTGLWDAYIPSPRLVWVIEILVIVGGHILGVLVAHRTAIRMEREHRGAVKSQYALTVLMSLFTITTLWLLAQPLVS